MSVDSGEPRQRTVAELLAENSGSQTGRRRRRRPDPAWDRDRLAKTGGSPEQYKHPCLVGDAAFRDTLPVVREVAG